MIGGQPSPAFSWLLGDEIALEMWVWVEAK